MRTCFYNLSQHTKLQALNKKPLALTKDFEIGNSVFTPYSDQAEYIIKGYTQYNDLILQPKKQIILPSDLEPITPKVFDNDQTIVISSGKIDEIYTQNSSIEAKKSIAILPKFLESRSFLNLPYTFFYKTDLKHHTLRNGTKLEVGQRWEAHNDFTGVKEDIWGEIVGFVFTSTQDTFLLMTKLNQPGFGKTIIINPKSLSKPAEYAVEWGGL